MEEFDGCPNCGSQEIEAMDLNEDSGTTSLVCTDCGHEFDLEVEIEQILH